MNDPPPLLHDDDDDDCPFVIRRKTPYKAFSWGGDGLMDIKINKYIFKIKNKTKKVFSGKL